jgi:hypothetical protein
VRCALGVEATRHNQGSLIFVSDQANHVEGARLGLLSALHLLERWIDDVQIAPI